MTTHRPPQAVMVRYETGVPKRDNIIKVLNDCEEKLSAMRQQMDDEDFNVMVQIYTSECSDE